MTTYRFQAALWRWHVAVWNHIPPDYCAAAVAAARAYADGGA